MQFQTSIQGWFLFSSHIWRCCDLSEKNIQRDERTDDGKDGYLWYRKESKKWRFSPGSDFRDQNHKCWMSLDSSGEEISMQ